MTIPEAYDLAVQHHQAGRLAEAEAIYRQILAVEPRDADSLHMLGLIAHHVGRSEAAVELMQQAGALAPQDPVLHSNLGDTLRRMGRLDDAIAACRRSIQLNPERARAHFNLGAALAAKGQSVEAIAAYRRSIQLDQNSAEAHTNLGVVLRDLGRLDEAIEAYRRALELEPGFAETHNNLGNALLKQGRLDEAIAAYRRALELQPDLVQTLSNLGNALARQGRFNEAIGAYRRALDLRPDYAEAHNNLGNALKDLGRMDEAMREYLRALDLQPRCAAAQHNLGNAQLKQDRLDEAINAYRRALDLEPDSVETLGNMGNALARRGEFHDAIAAYRCALELQPNSVEARNNLVYAALFHPAFDAPALREEVAGWDRQHGKPLRKFIRPHGNRPDPNRRLKIGYVSPDFWRHVIRHFLTPLLEAHDHAGFEIYCYASVKRPDAITERQRKSADVWRDVLGKSDEELAELIRRDEIDILVDLTQHMEDNRLPVFARKPAPVQVSWLGYPGSTGLSAIDYRLTDAQMEPEGAPWSESVEEAVRLPDSWFCFDPMDEYPVPGELPARRVGHVTFGCLNSFRKVNDAVLERWTGVLRAVPGSRLMLQCPEGSTRDRVRQFLAARGIGADRVDLLGKTATRAGFLDLYARMDIALDPFPYNGGTTTCEALWMGVPVLTLPRELIVARIGLSILSAVGLPEFIAQSESDYVRLAASLAADLPRLADYRATLRDRMKASPFMDGPRFARNVEAAYRQMWRTWCNKQSTLPPT